MKAIVHSPEWTNKSVFATSIPFGLMTNFHVQVRGYVIEKAKNGRQKSVLVRATAGRGKETLFMDIGLVRDKSVVENKASAIYNLYTKGTKFQSDGTEVGQEVTPYEGKPVQFTDSRTNKKKFNTKKDTAPSAA